MDKNLLAAVALSIVVYAAWFGFVEKRLMKQPPAPNAAASTSLNPATQAAEQTSKPSFAGSEPAPAAKDETEPARLGNADVMIRSRGAAIVSWKYQGPRGVVELVKNPDPGLLSTFPELAFHRIGAADQLMFSARRPDGVRVVKEFLPGGDTTPPRLKVTLENPAGRAVESGAWSISVGPGLGTIPAEEKENPKLTRTLGLTKAEGGLAGKVDVMKEPGERPADYRWVGVDNRYFLIALLPAPGDFAQAVALADHRLTLKAKNASIAAGATRSWDVPFYVGAKGHTWLSRYHLGLERAIDFGFFAQLGRIVLKVLDRLHSVLGNWGWSIILLTVLIQLLMFPLTFKSLKATTAMKRLQPEIARLQQRYSKDPTRLNTEMMALYKKHGANPLGGCLPMLVQMPIFYALYTALRNAWELHGAPWIFWIHDLSAKDPYYVLPLVMGGLMFAQNKMNPAAGVDPAQQQMMTFMPVIFTVMFLNFPSGLVLYWLTNSLVSTLQQLALRDRLAAEAA